jgi:hypothetical protein
MSVGDACSKGNFVGWGSQQMQYLNARQVETIAPRCLTCLLPSHSPSHRIEEMSTMQDIDITATAQECRYHENLKTQI